MSSDLFNTRQGRLSLAAAVLLVFAFAFGGASQLNALRLALVELAALPLLVLAATELVHRPELIRQHRFALALAGLTLAVPLIQLLPLPPQVWTHLPGRDQMALAQELAGLQGSWVPISLTPDATWNAALALLPPIAMFLAVLVSEPGLVRRLIWISLGALVINLFAGALQGVSGTHMFHPWPSTHIGSISGLMANRNHLATLILTCLPLAAWLVGDRLKGSRQVQGAGLLVAGSFFVLCLVGLAMGQSRAGVVLAFPVMALSLLVAWRASRAGNPGLPLLGIGAAVVVALTAVTTFALPIALERFGIENPELGRLDRWPFVVEAGNPYQPIGTGLGSFDPVYRSIEPLVQLDTTYFNQAHNEYLQIWLEAGLVGVAIVVAFLIWYGRRTISAWFGQAVPGQSLQRAASVGILVALLHSVVDYPLRTETIMVLFAMLCAVLEGAALPGRASASSDPAGEPEPQVAEEGRKRVRRRVRVRA